MTRRISTIVGTLAVTASLVSPLVANAHHGAAKAGGKARSTTGDVLQKQALGLAGAQRAIDAVMHEAKRLGTTGVVAVVDEGGNQIALARIDGTFAAGARVSAGKARTAVMFRKPTRFFEELIKQGRTPMIALDDFTPLQGGLPIILDGEVVGGIGVSGAASAQQDEDLAKIGVRALGAAFEMPPVAAKATPSAATPAVQGAAHGAAAWLPEVLFFPHERTDKGFAAGSPLVELTGFKIHTSRRDAPGKAEIHERDVDIFYVLGGDATVVTGGKVIDPERVGDGEVRGARIEGGKATRVTKGDVMVIPSGTPHWFRDVDGPITYYAVKYTVGAR